MFMTPRRCGRYSDSLSWPIGIITTLRDRQWLCQDIFHSLHPWSPRFGTSQAHAVVIDHNSVNAVSSYSQGTMDKIGDLNYFFAHASVGGNMVSGLSALHYSNATFYRFAGSVRFVQPGCRPPGWTRL